MAIPKWEEDAIVRGGQVQTVGQGRAVPDKEWTPSREDAQVNNVDSRT